MTTRPDYIANELDIRFPNLIVSRSLSNHGISIAIHPHKRGFPQVNIRWKDGTVEWQGYWGEYRWGYPIGRAIGLPNLDYVLPTKYGRATETIELKIDDEYTEGRLLAMSEDWFQQHPADEGHGEFPPIPDGLRMATEAEIEASRRTD